MFRIIREYVLSSEQVNRVDFTLFERLQCEECEEILIVLMTALHIRISKYDTDDFERLLEILKRLLLNKCSEVVKSACRILVALSSKAAKFEPYVAGSANSVIKLFQHKHSSIRQEALSCLEALTIVKSTPLENEGFPDMFVSMCGDTSTAVRSTLYGFCGTLMMELRDSYVHSSKLLPSLLIGLCDPVPDVAQHCSDALLKIGLLYEDDHADQVKDELDLFDDLEKKEVRRPGTIHIVNDNMLKLVNLASRHMKSWSPADQILGLKLLSSLLNFSNELVVGYSKQIFESILHIMSTSDEHKDSRYIGKVAKRLAGLVGMRNFVEVAKEFLDQNFSNATQANSVSLINHGMGNCQEYSDVFSLLTSPSLIYNSEMNIGKSVLELIDNFLDTSDASSKLSIDELAHLMMTLLFYSGSSAIPDAASVYRKFEHQVTKGTSIAPLFESCLIERLKNVTTAIDKKIACQFLIISDFDLFSEDTLVRVTESLIIPFSLAGYDEDQVDVPLRTVAFESLNRFFPKIIADWRVTTLLFEETILKNLKWHRQRESHIFREMSLILFMKLFGVNCERNEDIYRRLNDESCLKRVLSCLTDDQPRVRIGAISIVETVCNFAMTEEARRTLFSALIECTEDPERDVRLKVIRSASNFLVLQTETVSDPINVTEMLSKLIVYMDDEDEDIRVCTRNLFKYAIANNVVSVGFVDMNQSNFKYPLDLTY